MGKKIPRWESKLWSYVSFGDGERCPMRNHCHCQFKKRCCWCIEEHKKEVEQLLNSKHFSLKKCDAIGRGMVTDSDIYQRLARLAHSYLKRGNVHCLPVPTELFSLADEQHTIEARLLPLKAYHGAIWCLREGWIVQLKDSDTSASKRFTLFHEAFHILAHCRTIPVFRKRGSAQGSFNELLADYFAICILMPRKWVKEKWAEVEDLDRMSEIFDVPKPAMCIRLKQLGLV